MKDPFAMARKQAAGRASAKGASPAAPGASPAPQAPGVGQASGPTKAPGDFKALKKKFGLGSLKLDTDPIVARTQLMKHLADKLGPGFMSAPGIHDLIASFDAHAADSKEAQVASTQADRVGSLLG